MSTDRRPTITDASGCSRAVAFPRAIGGQSADDAGIHYEITPWRWAIPRPPQGEPAFPGQMGSL